MKRVLMTFTALMIFALAFSGIAQATPEWGFQVFDVAVGATKNNGFSELRYKDGTTKSYTDYSKSSTWKGGNLTFHNAFDGGNVYQSWANAELDENKWQANTYEYYHYGYFRLTNTAGISTDPLVGGTFNMDIKVKNTAKNAAYENMNTGPINFHWWENSNTNGAWFVFTETAWELGKMKDVNGVEFTLYLELKDRATVEEAGYTAMPEDLRAQAVADLGLASDANLYGWLTPDGKSQYMAFKISAYAPGANPHATPVPAAVWLMGTGVAGLVALRRRNAK